MLRTMEDVNSKMDLLDLMTAMLNVLQSLIIFLGVLLEVVLLSLWEMMLLHNTMPLAADYKKKVGRGRFFTTKKQQI